MSDQSLPASQRLQKLLATFDETSDPIRIYIESTPDRAKKIKREGLSVIYLVKPTAPYVKDDIPLYAEATIDHPTSIGITRHVIYGSLGGIFAFSKTSGRVLGSTVFAKSLD